MEDVSIDEKPAMHTDAHAAQRFVEATDCDSLAIAIGASHGASRFSGSQSRHFDRIAEIKKRLPGFPLVMHGSSSVPAEEIQRINATGGRLNPAVLAHA
jgi:fructose-bisphosphate aldolase, class II